MSSIRSASSSTKISSCSRSTKPWPWRSISRPGVATRMSTPRFSGLHLGVLAHAAEDDGGAQGQVLAIGLEALLDLEGQLPGGGEDQGADGAALRPGRR